MLSGILVRSVILVSRFLDLGLSRIIYYFYRDIFFMLFINGLVGKKYIRCLVFIKGRYRGRIGLELVFKG